MSTLKCRSYHLFRRMTGIVGSRNSPQISSFIRIYICAELWSTIDLFYILSWSGSFIGQSYSSPISSCFFYCFRSPCHLTQKCTFWLQDLCRSCSNLGSELVEKDIEMKEYSGKVLDFLKKNREYSEWYHTTSKTPVILEPIGTEPQVLKRQLKQLQVRN